MQIRERHLCSPSQGAVSTNQMLTLRLYRVNEWRSLRVTFAICARVAEAQLRPLARRWRPRRVFTTSHLLIICTFPVQPDNRVIRSCGWDDSNYKNKCYQRSGFGGRQEVCACDSDFCNGSNSVYASALLLLGSYVLSKASV